MAAATNADWAASCVTAPLIAPAQASSAKTKAVPLTTGQFVKRISRASVPMLDQMHGTVRLRDPSALLQLCKERYHAIPHLYHIGKRRG